MFNISNKNKNRQANAKTSDAKNLPTVTAKPQVAKKTPSRGRRSTYGKKVYTPAEIQEMLKGYILVPPDEYKSIPSNTHIRYMRKDGSFVRGGFVKNHWMNPDNEPVIRIKNTPGFAIGTTWMVYHKAIDKLYQKPGVGNDDFADMSNVKNRTAEIINEVNKLVSIVKKQGAKIAELERKQDRMHSAMIEMNNRLGSRRLRPNSR
jgi:hypothetical protein